jgi:4-hydroxy-2-oxoheptanedioate aldolase
MTEINGWLSIPHPYSAALFAGAGWDSVTLDAQHGLFDDAGVYAVLQALSAGAPKRYVRVPANAAWLVGRALDAGADGVIAPLVNSVEEAKRLAGAAWYPPRGRRSFGPSLAALRARGRPYEAVAADISVFAMIETGEALEAVEDIAAVDGITGLYVGPNDLALALGLGPGSDREEPQMIEAFRRIIAAAASNGKTAGIYCSSADYARRMASLGFGMVTAGSDGGVLARGAAEIVNTVRSAG